MVREINRIYTELLKTRVEYFATWDKDNFNKASEEDKEKAYNDYATRHYCYNRDNFECQIDGCTFDDSPLTIHHYKHRSNKGKTTPRNCVTICRAHQNHYHSAKTALVYKKIEYLPNHIAGKTQALDRYVNKARSGAVVRPKLQKRKMRIRRKELKEYWGIKLTWQQVMICLCWLFGMTDNLPTRT